MKTKIKSLLSATMRAASLSAFVLYRLEALCVGDRKAFAMICQWVSLVPGLTGEWFRRAFLQWHTGLRLSDCCISFGTTFSDPRVIIGNGVYLGRGCDIGFAEIGNNCLIGSSVHILSGLKQHSFEDPELPMRNQPQEFSKVAIGEDTWIGNGAIIAADVGRKCIIGAGAVVVKALPDFAIAVGNPARIVKYRDGRGSKLL